jgi:hypothetical protein
MKHEAFTQLILRLNGLLDSGKHDDITVEEIKNTPRLPASSTTA